MSNKKATIGDLIKNTLQNQDKLMDDGFNKEHVGGGGDELGSNRRILELPEAIVRLPRPLVIVGSTKVISKASTNNNKSNHGKPIHICTFCLMSSKISNIDT